MRHVIFASLSCLHLLVLVGNHQKLCMSEESHTGSYWVSGFNHRYGIAAGVPCIRVEATSWQHYLGTFVQSQLQ